MKNAMHRKVIKSILGAQEDVFMRQFVKKYCTGTEKLFHVFLVTIMVTTAKAVVKTSPNRVCKCPK